MHNFVTKFRKILEICKNFSGNQVNEKENVSCCGVVPTFSDLEVVAFSFTAEALSIDSENYLFKRLYAECPGQQVLNGQGGHKAYTIKKDCRFLSKNGSQGCGFYHVAVFQSHQ